MNDGADEAMLKSVTFVFVLYLSMFSDYRARQKSSSLRQRYESSSERKFTKIFHLSSVAG